jgi:glycerol-3-phosphate cytidylyltransferase
MFHAGHLNILKHARDACDRLVVGVVTDEVLERVKGRSPMYPLAERLTVVKALRLVDDVVVDLSSDKTVAWRAVRFDVLFKGDDWRDTPKGDRLEAELAGVGARVHYFPYTRHVSSTALRRLAEDAGRG